MTERRHTTRRDAIKTLAGAAALVTLGGSRELLANAGPVVLARPGVQLYTLRSEMEKSVEGTLARVAQLGYREVEFAGYFKKTPPEIAAILKANGLTAPSTHVGRDAIGAGWDKVLDDTAAVGHQWAVVAWIPEADRVSADRYKRLAAEFNMAAEAARKRGISFAYHNHEFEFTPLGNTNGHTVLFQECDPKLVQFELDLFWITKAGKDAAGYVAQHPGRFPLVHVKDMTADGTMTEVGKGTIDFQRILDAGKGSIKHCFVEHDNPKGPFESIGTSIEAMRRLRA